MHKNLLSLSELQRLVRHALDERFPLPVWVAAEISEIKVNYSGHCYLELIEKGDDNGVPTAQARAVLWRTVYPRVAGRFEAETGQRLAAGIRILAKVAITYHEIFGLSLQITDIDPAYTLGDMERQRQQTIAQLRKEGVWEMNREVPMPQIVQRIAVVSSAQAAGYRDFSKELENSPYRIDHTLFDAFMQGAAAEESIIAALCAMADRQQEFDAVVIIRGGGSASDLNCFNAYRLCAYIAQFPLPIVTGIGHDKDTSVADMVAHTALKTPTAVAGWFIDRMVLAHAHVDRAAQQLHDAVMQAIRTDELILRRQQSELTLTAAGFAAQHRQRINALVEQLPDTVKQMLDRHLLRLDAAAELVDSRSPQRILRLGFAVVRRARKTIRSVRDIHTGDHLDVEVADGTFTTEITKN